MAKLLFKVAPQDYWTKNGDLLKISVVTLSLGNYVSEWKDFKQVVPFEITHELNENDLTTKNEHLNIKGYSIPWNMEYAVKAIFDVYKIEKERSINAK